MSQILMKCGCIAQGTCSAHHGQKFDPPIPCCIPHDCLEIADIKPSLEGRLAKCDYYGHGGFRNYEHLSRFGGKCSETKCECIVPSSYDLPFFSLREQPHSKHKEYDSYYCGCAGWD